MAPAQRTAQSCTYPAPDATLGSPQQPDPTAAVGPHSPQRGSTVTPDPDTLWSRCARLGRVLLPLVDQEPGRRAERHENLRIWDIDTTVGERTIEVFTALAAHAVAVDAAVPAARFGSLSVRSVAEAATGKQDFELLAGPVEPVVSRSGAGLSSAPAGCAVPGSEGSGQRPGTQGPRRCRPKSAKPPASKRLTPPSPDCRSGR